MNFTQEQFEKYLPEIFKSSFYNQSVEAQILSSFVVGRESASKEFYMEQEKLCQHIVELKEKLEEKDFKMEKLIEQLKKFEDTTIPT